MTRMVIPARITESIKVFNVADTPTRVAITENSFISPAPIDLPHIYSSISKAMGHIAIIKKCAIPFIPWPVRFVINPAR